MMIRVSQRRGVEGMVHGQPFITKIPYLVAKKPYYYFLRNFILIHRYKQEHCQDYFQEGVINPDPGVQAISRGGGSRKKLPKLNTLLNFWVKIYLPT